MSCRLMYSAEHYKSYVLIRPETPCSNPSASIHPTIHQNRSQLSHYRSHGTSNCSLNPGKIGRGTVRPFAIEPLDHLHVHRNETIQVAASTQNLIGVPVPRAMRDQVRRDSALGGGSVGESGVVVKGLVQRA